MSEFQIDEKTLRKIKLPLLIDNESWLLELANFENEIITELKNECEEQVELEKSKEKELREYKKEKKKLLDLILEFSKEVNENDDTKAENYLDKTKERILELNFLIDDIQFELEMLPKEINRLNKLLFNETITSVYNYIDKGKSRLVNLDAEIQETRKALGDMYQEKFSIENTVESVYKYLHKTLGKDETNRLDHVFFQVDDGR